ncbi:hypothetical protein, partial [Polluticaenibacter yanchengensis]|nr:hypothetical protein [Chitinophagaceae bacterium LY-5]
FRVFAIGAYFEKVNEQIVLKIALVKNDESGSLHYGLNLKIFISLFLMCNLELLVSPLQIYYDVSAAYHTEY